MPIKIYLFIFCELIVNKYEYKFRIYQNIIVDDT